MYFCFYEDFLPFIFFISGRYFLQLIVVSKEQPGRRHSSISLHCKLRGKRRPFAKFSWEKDGLPLVASSRRFIKTRLRSERLRIKSIRAIDSGKYRCLAIVNGMKIRSKRVKLFFHGKTFLPYKYISKYINICIYFS